MIVCAHGDVADYCKEHDMLINEQYSGDIEKYSGDCLVIVTDQEMTKNEFYYLKAQMLRRGIELVSTRYCSRSLDEFIAYQHSRESQKHHEKSGGRQIFGFYSQDGVVYEKPEELEVVKLIIGLRDLGMSYRQISEADKVCYSDGRKMSVSTIQAIIKNRNRYER